METTKTFQSPDLQLSDLLKDISKGKVQLPDFQRDWVWDDEHVKSLLASVSQSYPIGAIMMLESDDGSVNFRPLLMKGVELAETATPDQLVLDGQQRLTSLFLSLSSGKPVPTKDSRGNPYMRWYYIDINEALNPYGDREESVVSVPEDRIVRNFRSEPIHDYSTPEAEYENEVFPLSMVFDASTWRRGYNKFWNHDEEHSRRWDDFEEGVIKRFEQYQVPAIVLSKQTPKEAVCQVFEKVNTGGVTLTVFELLTATYAVDSFSLRDDWDARRKRFKEDRLLRAVESTDFLQAISLLSTRARRNEVIGSGEQADKAPGISCKRKDVLKLKLADYRYWADDVEKSFGKAARLLHTQKIFDSRDVPYRTQLIPLAAIMTALGDKAEHDTARQRLIQWYWCGVFGELYGSAIESRFAKDLPEVFDWVKGGAEASTVTEANFNPTRLLTLRTRNSAAYKGLYAVLMRDGGLDFQTGEPIQVQSYFDDRIDIHHIFPQAWCQTNNVEPARCDSIINKAPIAAKTNRTIGGNAPSVYLRRLETSGAGISAERMDEILQSHLIGTDALRADDFDSFFAARQKMLIGRIEQAMGKPVMQLEAAIVLPVPQEYEAEDDE